jgi:hypothetical protein
MNDGQSSDAETGIVKIESQEQFNRVVCDALRNLYLLGLDPEAVVADSYGTGLADEFVRQQMADLSAYAFPEDVAFADADFPAPPAE